MIDIVAWVVAVIAYLFVGMIVARWVARVIVGVDTRKRLSDFDRFMMAFVTLAWPAAAPLVVVSGMLALVSRVERDDDEVSR